MSLVNSDPSTLQPSSPAQCKSRYLALWFAFLPADRLARQNRASPEQARPASVFIEKQRGALRLVAVSREALAQGLEPGLTLADARARVPALVAVEADPAADRALLERIADFCDRYTPLVALDGQDGLVLDITGCAHLFGGEAALREHLCARCQKAGVQVASAIASTPDAARALARYGGGGIVASGLEPAAVAPLSVMALGIDRQSVLALERAGLATLGDLAARPRAPLAARFGSDLPRRLARVLGEEDIAITPRRPLPPCTAERQFADPIARQEDVLATIGHLLEQAGAMLERRGEGGMAFEASLFRTDGTVHRLEVMTSLPTRARAPVERLFSERIHALAEPLDAGFGYDLVRLCVPLCAPFVAGQASLDGHEAADEDVAALIDRLSTRLGRDAVLRFVSAQTHIPERASFEVPAADALHAGGQALPQDWPHDLHGAAAQRPIHLFAHPQPIEALAEVPDGPPLKFRWRRVLHDVARAEGPERIGSQWWRTDDDGLTRDYYRVEDPQGRRYWVFRDGLYAHERARPRWFIHGLFP